MLHVLHESFKCCTRTVSNLRNALKRNSCLQGKMSRQIVSHLLYGKEAPFQFVKKGSTIVYAYWTILGIIQSLRSREVVCSPGHFLKGAVNISLENQINWYYA